MSYEEEEVVVEGDVSRRDMLRKTAAGATLGAAAFAVPSVTSLGVAPAHAQTCSGVVCTPNLETDLSFTIAGNLIGPFDVLVVEGAGGACSISITVPATDFPFGIQTADFTATLSNGQQVGGLITTGVATVVMDTFDCVPTCVGGMVEPISVVSAEALLVGGGFFPPPGSVLDAIPGGANQIIVCP